MKEARILDELVAGTTTDVQPPYVIRNHITSNTQTKRMPCKARVKQLHLTKQRIACDLPRSIGIRAFLTSGKLALDPPLGGLHHSEPRQSAWDNSQVDSLAAPFRERGTRVERQ